MKISYKNIKRYKEILRVLVKYGFTFIVEKLNMENVAFKSPIIPINEEVKNMTTGQKLRFAMEELGPTFIKLGQILSFRTDLLEPEIVDELAKLRYSVEVFDTEIAKEIFYNETGKNIEEVFEEFNYTPIAAASIGQVYECRLKTGEDVVLKIQRPNIEDTIKSDIEILRSICKVIQENNDEIQFDLLKILEEFNTQLMRELDYNFEAMNAIKFKNIFEGSTNIHIPKIYEEFTTRKILVLEKIIGVKVDDKQKIKQLGWDTDKISQIGIRAFFKQILEHGFFHADLHPGNIFVVASDCISYIDFGMVGMIDNKTLSSINALSLAIVNKNIDKVIYILEDMNISNKDTNKIELKQDLLYIMHYYYDVKITEIKMAQITNELFRLLRKHKISLPYELSMLVKTIVTLEGTARELNPNFSLKTIISQLKEDYYKYAFDTKKIVNNTLNNTQEIIWELKHIPKQVNSVLKNLEQNNVKVSIQDINTKTLERSIFDLSTKLSISLVLSALLVGSSMIIASPNINNDIWIKIIAFGGFGISFILGILLVIKIYRTHYKK